MTKLAVMNTPSQKKHQTREFIRKVIDKAGGTGPVRVALKISRQSIFNWTQIPAEHCADLEALSGIAREKLRPDIFKVSKLKKAA